MQSERLVLYFDINFTMIGKQTKESEVVEHKGFEASAWALTQLLSRLI